MFFLFLFFCCWFDLFSTECCFVKHQNHLLMLQHYCLRHNCFVQDSDWPFGYLMVNAKMSSSRQNCQLNCQRWPSIALVWSPQLYSMCFVWDLRCHCHCHRRQRRHRRRRHSDRRHWSIALVPLVTIRRPQSIVVAFDVQGQTMRFAVDRQCYC